VGLDGIICTDAGSLRNMVNPKLHNYYKTNAEGAAGSVKAGINQFLESPSLYRDGHEGSAATESAGGEGSRRRDQGRVPRDDQARPAGSAGDGEVRRIKGDEEVWKRPEHKEIAKRVAQESVVLLKNANHFLPLDKAKSLKSIAVLGPLADVVALDWYSGTPGYVRSRRSRA
jgi:beta-glucosidase